MLEEHLKALNKRGHYFNNAIHIPMSQKHSLTPVIISWIREQVIFRKKTQAEICLAITNALESNSYQTIRSKPKEYNSIRELVQARQKTLHFLLRCSEDDFKEITKITKYDWDYQGEDKKLPSREEYLKYINKKSVNFEDVGKYRQEGT